MGRKIRQGQHDRDLLSLTSGVNSCPGGTGAQESRFQECLLSQGGIQGMGIGPVPHGKEVDHQTRMRHMSHQCHSRYCGGLESQQAQPGRGLLFCLSWGASLDSRRCAYVTSRESRPMYHVPPGPGRSVQKRETRLSLEFHEGYAYSSLATHGHDGRYEGMWRLPQGGAQGGVRD